MSVEKLLDHFFCLLVKGEKIIEKQRQVLARKKQFEPFAAFKRIDRDDSGFLTSVELLHFLR